MIRKLFVVMLIMVMVACHHSVKKDQLTMGTEASKSAGCMEPNCPASKCINPAKGCIEKTEKNKDGFLKGYVKCENCEPDRKDVYMQTPTEPPFFTHTDRLVKKVNSAYPDWYRGCAASFNADACSHHFYYVLTSPERFLEPGESTEDIYPAENAYCGIFNMKSGKTYPAHTHPSREFYYIIDGEADWYAGDEVRKVKAGSFMVHPPFTPHGWTVTSEQELKTFFCWWREDRDDPKSLDNGGRFTNPCINEDENSAEPDIAPLDRCK